MQRKILALCPLLVASALFLGGCATSPEPTTTQVSKSADTPTTASTDTPAKADTPPVATDAANSSATPAAAAPSGDQPKAGDEVAVLDTSKGQIVFAFLPDKAPNHVANFKMLANKKFFDGTRFHRCIPGFMIQGGDPNSKDLSKADRWGTGGYMVSGKEQNVKAEFNSTSHVRGIVSMARGGDPDSASSQFFIMTSNNPGLDGQYSAFGKVLSGMDVADQIVTTGDPNANGKVEPTAAVVLKTVRIQKWPVK